MVRPHEDLAAGDHPETTLFAADPMDAGRTAEDPTGADRRTLR